MRHRVFHPRVSARRSKSRLAQTHRYGDLQPGFTILEVAMAASVMVLGITTAIIALQSGFQHLDLARGTTLASQIIQSEMERVRLMSWSGVAGLPATETFDGALHFDGSSALAGKYSVTRACAPDPARPAEIMHIDVAVSWRGYDGRLHRRSSISTYAKNGLYDYYYTIAHP